jgi:hypothetical protein
MKPAKRPLSSPLWACDCALNGHKALRYILRHSHSLLMGVPVATIFGTTVA